MAIVLGQHSHKDVSICRTNPYPKIECSEHKKHVIIRGAEIYEPSWSTGMHKIVDFLNNSINPGETITITEDVSAIMGKYFFPTNSFDKVTTVNLLKEVINTVENHELAEPDYAYSVIIQKIKSLADNLYETITQMSESESTSNSDKENFYKTAYSDYMVLLQTATLMLEDMKNYSLDRGEGWQYFNMVIPEKVEQLLVKRNAMLSSSVAEIRRNSNHMFVKALHKSQPYTGGVKHLFSFYDGLGELVEPTVELNMKKVGNIILPHLEIYSFIKLTPATTDLLENYLHSTRLEIAREAQLALNILLRVGSLLNAKML
jgi:hypothetical protein